MMDTTAYYEENDDYHEKCGEIFLTLKGNIAFHCTLCENGYKSFEDYNKHLLSIHYAPVFKEEFTDLTNDDDNSLDPLREDSISGVESSIVDEHEELEILITPEEVSTPLENFSEDNSTELVHIRNEDSSTASNISDKEINRPKLGRILNPKITDRKFKCPLCGFTCSDKSNIKGHIKRHSINKPHKCSQCLKGFHTRTELNTHLRTHTGERPYLCTLCGQAFTTSSKLSNHQKRHYNIRDKECPICKMRFYGLDSLRGHMSVHSEKRDYKCELCDASFKIPLSLKNHMKLHANKRQYKCQLCDASFNQNAGLYSHMKSTHTLVKSKTERKK